MVKLSSVLFLSLFSVAAFADDPAGGIIGPLNLTPTDCPNAANAGLGSEVGMAACRDEASKIFDADLNQTDQKLMKSFEAQDANDNTHQTKLALSLREAQRAWIQLRNSQCKIIYYLNPGGKWSSRIEKECLLVMTRRRTSELKDFKR